jgi:hypothetical protein
MKEMSGLDEQHKDFPGCTYCNKKIDYWLLMSIGIESKWIWFFSNDFLKNQDSFDIVTYRRCNRKFLAKIDFVRCVKCNKRYYIDNELFKQVLEAVKYYTLKEKIIEGYTG